MFRNSLNTLKTTFGVVKMEIGSKLELFLELKFKTQLNKYSINSTIFLNFWILWYPWKELIFLFIVSSNELHWRNLFFSLLVLELIFPLRF